MAPPPRLHDLVAVRLEGRDARMRIAEGCSMAPVVPATSCDASVVNAGVHQDVSCGTA